MNHLSSILRRLGSEEPQVAYNVVRHSYDFRSPKSTSVQLLYLCNVWHLRNIASYCFL